MRTKWFSHHTTGVGGWNVDLAYYPSIMLHTAKYRCNNSTQESPIPMKQHRTACSWPSVSDELGSCETHFTGVMKRPSTHQREVCAVRKTLSTDSTLDASRQSKKVNNEPKTKIHTGLRQSENSWFCAREQTWQIWLEKNRWGPLLLLQISRCSLIKLVLCNKGFREWERADVV